MCVHAGAVRGRADVGGRVGALGCVCVLAMSEYGPRCTWVWTTVYVGMGWGHACVRAGDVCLCARAGGVCMCECVCV